MSTNNPVIKKADILKKIRIIDGEMDIIEKQAVEDPDKVVFLDLQKLDETRKYWVNLLGQCSE